MLFYRKKLLLFLLLLIIPSSCGFQPLYKRLDNKTAIIGIIDIPEISGKEGFHLREELIRQLGDPKQPAFKLVLSIQTNKINEVITPDNQITSYRLIMIAQYSLENEFGEKILPTQKSTVRTGFSSASNSTGYTTQTAEETAKKRLAIKIASEISTRLFILSEKWLP